MHVRTDTSMLGLDSNAIAQAFSKRLLLKKSLKVALKKISHHSAFLHCEGHRFVCSEAAESSRVALTRKEVENQLLQLILEL